MTKPIESHAMNGHTTNLASKSVRFPASKSIGGGVVKPSSNGDEKKKKKSSVPTSRKYRSSVMKSIKRVLLDEFNSTCKQDSNAVNTCAGIMHNVILKIANDLGNNERSSKMSTVTSGRIYSYIKYTYPDFSEEIIDLAKRAINNVASSET
jgi:hypothetical protein